MGDPCNAVRLPSTTKKSCSRALQMLSYLKKRGEALRPGKGRKVMEEQEAWKKTTVAQYEGIRAAVDGWYDAIEDEDGKAKHADLLDSIHNTIDECSLEAQGLTNDVSHQGNLYAFDGGARTGKYSDESAVQSTRRLVGTGDREKICPACTCGDEMYTYLEFSGCDIACGAWCPGQAPEGSSTVKHSGGYCCADATGIAVGAIFGGG